jgi:hypothetical protein
MSNDLAKIENKDIQLREEVSVNNLPLLNVKTAVEMKKYFDEVKKAIFTLLTDSEDYGIIPGFGKKPTLYKAGADKLCTIFGYSSIVKSKECIMRDRHYLWYVEVAILNKNEQIIATGIGSYSTREIEIKQKKTIIPEQHENTALKMAHKRAYVSAVISATRISNLFTQDLEELAKIDDSMPSLQEQERYDMIENIVEIALQLGYDNINNCISKMSNGQYDNIEKVPTDLLPKYLLVLTETLNKKIAKKQEQENKSEPEQPQQEIPNNTNDKSIQSTSEDLNDFDSVNNAPFIDETNPKKEVQQNLFENNPKKNRLISEIEALANELGAAPLDYINNRLKSNASSLNELEESKLETIIKYLQGDKQLNSTKKKEVA